MTARAFDAGTHKGGRKRILAIGNTAMAIAVLVEPAKPTRHRQAPPLMGAVRGWPIRGRDHWASIMTRGSGQLTVQRHRYCEVDYNAPAPGCPTG